MAVVEGAAKQVLALVRVMISEQEIQNRIEFSSTRMPCVMSSLVKLYPAALKPLSRISFQSSSFSSKPVLIKFYVWYSFHL